ncbi:translation initiation factor IF-3 [Halobacteriovorax sp. XZX-3]|uniref:translation initiation factor IF-3 n=1 Tax=unclassified Halobacteriovorax TaxID=2639665 RepID=UPI000CD2D28D|nr:translation initiation factor IF-3 [Halobacteriovorax sp. DA5]POB14277.1 translation initiation factor IF-3 [Halobacteriovorax sp. DA5]
MSNNFKGGRVKKERGPRINEQIRISECRLMSDEEQYGVVSIDRAREIAEELGVDLIEIAPTAKPPVVKLMDYGKYKYALQKKAAEAKKKQAKVQLKEIQLRPNIEAHDLETKLKRAYKFLEGGDKVKFVMQFRGREMAYKDMGKEKFEAILNGVCEEADGVIESPIKMMGNRIITIVAPGKKK